MREVGTLEARNTLSALLEAVENGEEVVITRHGRPVARLIREPSDGAERERARAAADRLERLSRGVTLGGQSIRSLIDEGRL